MIQSLIMDSQPIIPTGAMDNTRKELIAPAAPPTSSGTALSFTFNYDFSYDT